MSGMMSIELNRIYQNYIGSTDFILIGHPKNFSNISIENVECFMQEVCSSAVFKTVHQLAVG